MASRSTYVYMIRLDVPPEKEAEFNELYNNEHIPALLKVPGVLRASRYTTDDPGAPKHLAIYEMDRPNVRESEDWVKAANSGEWQTKVRPFITNISRSNYKLVHSFE